MKTMTCQELGGACNVKFTADTFDEIVEMSKKHGAEMFQKKDSAHLKAMESMKELMKDPNAMGAWFHSKKEAFNKLPHLS